MKLQNLTGEIATVNHKAYDTWLEPYIGCNVEIERKTAHYAYVVIDRGNGDFSSQKVVIDYFDFPST